MALSNKQRAFVEHYIILWNASEAARRAGYSHKNANVVGPRLLANVGISAEISLRLANLQMSADEVLVRLTEHARGTMADFVDIKTGALDLKKADDAGKMHLLKKYIRTTSTTRTDEGSEITDDHISLELYDAQAALVDLGKHHKLFTERHEHSGPDGGPIVVEQATREQAEKELSEWRQQQIQQLSTQSAPLTQPISPTPTA